MKNKTLNPIMILSGRIILLQKTQAKFSTIYLGNLLLSSFYKSFGNNCKKYLHYTLY